MRFPLLCSSLFTGSTSTDIKRRNASKGIYKIYIQNLYYNCDFYCFTFVALMLCYGAFNKLSSILRLSSPSQQDVDTFRTVVEQFRKYMLRAIPSKKNDASQYLHVLLDDAPRYISFWHSFMGIGLGAFWSSCGEHSNKICKQEEADHCNFSSSRCKMIVENSIVRLLHYTKSIMRNTTRNITCGKCSTLGHQSNNKGCPLHETPLQFNIANYFTVQLTSLEKDLITSIKIFDFYIYNDDVGEQCNEDDDVVDL